MLPVGVEAVFSEVGWVEVILEVVPGRDDGCIPQISEVRASACVGFCVDCDGDEERHEGCEEE